MTRFTKRPLMTFAPVLALDAMLPGPIAPPTSAKTSESDQASISEFNGAFAVGMLTAAARPNGCRAG